MAVLNMKHSCRHAGMACLAPIVALRFREPPALSHRVVTRSSPQEAPEKNTRRRRGARGGGRRRQARLGSQRSQKNAAQVDGPGPCFVWKKWWQCEKHKVGTCKYTHILEDKGTGKAKKDGGNSKSETKTGKSLGDGASGRRN